MKSWLGFIIAAVLSLAVLILIDIFRQLQNRK